MLPLGNVFLPFLRRFTGIRLHGKADNHDITLSVQVRHSRTLLEFYVDSDIGGEAPLEIFFPVIRERSIDDVGRGPAPQT